tara:strand:+ start:67 stop:579 length:513 start_codon:yes stop_codon:yes gene_type:complete
VDKSIFIKAMTEGMFVCGANNGLEIPFTSMLNDFLSKSNTYLFHYIESELPADSFDMYQKPLGGANSIILEGDLLGSPILKIVTKDDLLNFEKDIYGIDKRFTKEIGSIVFNTISFVNAWNKKAISLDPNSTSKDSYRMDKKYDLDFLLEKHKMFLIALEKKNNIKETYN